MSSRIVMVALRGPALSHQLLSRKEPEGKIARGENFRNFAEEKMFADN